METSTPDRSALFKVYNSLRTSKSPRVEEARLKKALSLAQSKDRLDKYFTTLTGCTCPDAMRRSQFICKHRLALMMRNPAEAALIIFEEL